jgi:DNA-binding XRE family transcriptional regulator
LQVRFRLNVPLLKSRFPDWETAFLRGSIQGNSLRALEKSRIIAINILAQLRKLGMSQKDLAEKLQVTPQTVNSWVKGNSNFTIETIVRIEEVLGVELIGV